MTLFQLSPTATVLILSLLGDIVVLHNGREIQGEIVAETPDRVVVGLPGGTVELSRKSIHTIHRQSRKTYLLEEGEKRLLRKDYEGAVETFAAAIAEAPDSEPVRKGLLRARESLARYLRTLGRYAEAKALFVELAAERPNDPGPREEIQAIDRALKDARLQEEKGLREIEGENPEAGILRLQEIYDRFPDRRKAIGEPLGAALVRRGDAFFETSDLPRAESCYIRALTFDPDLAPQVDRRFVAARIRRILPLAANGDFETVEALTLEGLDVDPTSEELRYYRGLCWEAKGGKREAAEEYVAILDVKRPASLEDSVGELRMDVEARLLARQAVNPTASPESTTVLEGDFRELKSAHFVVRHKSPGLAQDVALVAERTYAELFAELNCITHPRVPLQIVLYPTREEYVEASGLGEWSGGSHRIARRLGNLSDHRILSYQGQPRLTSGLIQHELAHALLAHRLNYPQQIPLWANEGFALTREPTYVHKHCRGLVRWELKRRTAFPLSDLLALESYPEDRIDLFYAQSLSIVEFLLSEKDLQVFLVFLRAISDHPAEVEPQLRRHYRIRGIEALENRWRSWFEYENP